MSIITTYLEMTSRDALRARTCDDPRFRVLEASVKQWEYNRFLYAFVGGPWAWRDKLQWSEEQWKVYAEAEGLDTCVAYYDGSPAGYFELSRENDEIQIAYFGLASRFFGKGFGGALLTYAIQKAWESNPTRVWVHTCTLDHPAALPNYLARGMTPYKTEEKEAND